MVKKAMLIQNPKAGKERPEKYRASLLKILAEHFDEVSEVLPGETSTQCSRRACEERYDAVICVGGDGTLDAVVSGMAEQDYRPKLCVLPGGTFNMICRIMGLPMDMLKALKEIDFKRTGKMHVGKVNDRYFSFILSTGTISEEIHDVSAQEKKKFGFLAYAANILRALPSIKTKPGKIRSEDFSYEGSVGHMVYILNQEFIHFRESIFNKTDPCGLLMITKDDKVRTAIPVLNTVLEKHHIMEKEQFLICRLDDFCFDTPGSETDFDLDGDLGGKTPFDVQVLRDHIEVYLPRETTGIFELFR